jgi:general secretion pathway protein N
VNVRVARLATTVLAGACGFLLFTALLQYAGVGSHYGWAPDDPDSEPPLPGNGAVDDKPLKLPPASAFAEVEMHPIFNEDRKPTPIDASEGEDSSAPQSPLNITLTGIISTSSIKIAMVQDKARNQSVALKVGMPLEGDQASWTLVEVKPRSVVFKSAANEKTEVELETSVAQPPKAPPVPMPRTARTGSPANDARKGSAPNNPRNNGPDKDKKDSGDLAKRIEERRRQMREDAEKLRSQGKGPPTKPEPPPKK